MHDASIGGDAQGVVNDSRYQNQNLWVRSLRWWRWMPLYKCKALVAIVRWIASGAEPDEFCGTRRRTVEHLWGIHTGLAQAKMNWLYTTDEVREFLRD